MLLYVVKYFAYNVCMHTTHMLGTHRGQKLALDPLESGVTDVGAAD